MTVAQRLDDGASACNSRWFTYPYAGCDDTPD